MDLDDIVLREISDTDANDYFNYMSRKEMKPYLAKENLPDNIDQATKDVVYWKNLFYNKKSIYWAIATKNDNAMIGTIGFNVMIYDHARAEISYDLSPDYWGKGIMLKSLKQILQFADQHLQLVRVQATVMLINDRSIKALERTGFMREGILKKYEIISNKHHDYYMYARINPTVIV